MLNHLDKVAIKIVDRSRLDAKNLRMLSREVSTLESVQHPYILRLFEVVETLGRVHLVTEFIAGGELYYKIVQNGVYSERKAVKIFKQLALAIQHMVREIYIRDVSSIWLIWFLTASSRLRSSRCQSGERSCVVGRTCQVGWFWLQHTSNRSHALPEHVLWESAVCLAWIVQRRSLHWQPGRHLGARDSAILRSRRQHAILVTNSSSTSFNDPQRRISHPRSFVSAMR